MRLSYQCLFFLDYNFSGMSDLCAFYGILFVLSVIYFYRHQVLYLANKTSLTQWSKSSKKRFMAMEDLRYCVEGAEWWS